MIHMSKQTDYAVQLLIALSKMKKGEYLSLRAFSEESNISFLFLQRIVRSLKEAGIVDANRGVHGGYYLVKDPKKVTLKDLMEAVEGRFGITRCLKGQNCMRSKTCASKKVFTKVNREIEQLLNSVSVLQA